MPNLTARGHVLRKGRVSLNSQIYMITACTNKRAKLFENFYKGRCVVSALMRTERSAETLAYVVMPDHLHWLMQLRSGYDLARVMRFAKSETTRQIRVLHGDSDLIWQRGFYDQAVRDDEDIVNFARYIVANPIRAGLVKSVREYPLWDAKWL